MVEDVSSEAQVANLIFTKISLISKMIDFQTILRIYVHIKNMLQNALDDAATSWAVSLVIGTVSICKPGTVESMLILQVILSPIDWLQSDGLTMQLYMDAEGFWSVTKHDTWKSVEMVYYCEFMIIQEAIIGNNRTVRCHSDSSR